MTEEIAPEGTVTEGTVTEGPPSAWAPLKYPIFRAMFIAQIASNVGTMMHNVGAAWLMGDLNPSPTLVALVQTATMLPVFLVGLPAGALADIIDRRKLLIITQLSMALTTAVLAVVTFSDAVTAPMLLVLTFALGLGGAFTIPAWQAIQPELVPRADLPQALALGNTTFNVGRAIGPAIGGLIVAGAGVGWVFVVNAVSFLGVVAVLVGWHRAPTATGTQPPERLAGALRAGLRYGAHSIALRHVLVRAAALIVPASALVTLLPVVARGQLGLGSAGYGLLLGCFGIGAATSAFVRPRIVERVQVDTLMMLATVVLAVGLLIVGLVHNVIVVGIALLIVGAGWTLALTATGVAAQAALPSWVRARGMGLWNLAVTGGVAVGSLVWGLVAGWRVDLAFVIAAATLIVLFLLTRSYKLSLPDRLDVELAAMDAPIVRLMPRPTDGPVLVTVRYRVPDDALDRFANEMRRVERQRRRTGARQWGLFRDLTEVDVVLETYIVESWVEHLRQHERTTNTDLSVLGDARQYSIGYPEVSHLVSVYAGEGSRPRVRLSRQG